MVQPLGEKVWQFLMNIHLPCNLANLHLGVYPREMKSHIHETRLGMLLGALVLIAPNWTQVMSLEKEK